MAHGHSHDEDHGHGGHGGCSGHGGDLESPLLGGDKSPNPNAKDQQKLKYAVYCALFFMFIEIAGGIYSNSLAIITDAAHMLSDVGGFVVSLVALQLAAQGATVEYTYGFKQAEVLGALLSITIVWALTAVLLWEAVHRLMEPQEIDAPFMFVISVIGFVVNLVLMQVLGHGHSHGDGGHGHSHGGEADEESSVAVQAAVAHVIGDIVQSLGVCLASLCIWVKPFDLGVASNGVSKWNYADPCCTFLFGILVLYTTKSTLVYTVDSLMVRAPKHIDQDKIIQQILAIPNAESVHDFHVWSMGSANVLCTAHIQVKGSEHGTKVLQAAIRIAQGMGIGHSTFQIEFSGEFDPAIENFGGFTCHEHKATGKTPRAADDHGHEHGGDAGHKAHGGNDHGHEHGGDAGHKAHGGHGGHADHGHENGGCSGHAH